MTVPELGNDERILVGRTHETDLGLTCDTHLDDHEGAEMRAPCQLMPPRMIQTGAAMEATRTSFLLTNAWMPMSPSSRP